MAALTLPASPGPARQSVRLVSSSNKLSSAFGGGDIREARLGARYAAAFTLPPMTYAEAMAWTDLEAEVDTVRMRIRQPDFVNTSGAGTPLVDGAGQAGNSITLKGLGAGYTVKKGQFLSVTTGGRLYLYRSKSEVTASGAGGVSVSLRTVLRWPHANNDPVELVTPSIEGFVSAGEDMFAIDEDAFMAGVRFEVMEAA